MANFLTNAGESQACSDFLTAYPYLEADTAAADAEAGTVTAAGGGFTRQDISAAFGDPSNGVMTSDVTVDFGTASGAAGTITHVSFWSASSGGTCGGVQALTASKAVGDGDSFDIPSGSLVIDFTSGDA